MKTYFALAAAAALYAMPAAAIDPGPYASLGAGLNVTANSTPQQNAAAAAARQLEVSFKAGWGVRGAAGYAFPGWRAELEGGYRQASLGHVYDATASGKQNTFDIMGNLIFNVGGGGGGFQPYLGAGIGTAWTKWSSVTSGYSRVLSGALAVFDDNSPTAFQYQALAGVSFAITPTSDVFVDYRYIGSTAHKFESTAPTGFAISEHKDASHNLLVGVRFAFGAGR